MQKSVLAAVMAIGLGTAVQAATVDVSFSFENRFNGGGFVTGIARGLENNANSAATSVEILTNDRGFGLGEYTGSELVNSWTLMNGVITEASFTSFGIRNTAPAVTDASLTINDIGNATSRGGLGDFINVGTGVGSEVTFTVLSTTDPDPDPDPAPVPLPASALMLLAAMAGIVAMRGRRSA